MRENGRIDVIVGCPPLAQTGELMLQAQSEELLVGVHDLGDVGRRVEAAVAGGAKPLGRARLDQSELERMHPGGADQLHAAGALEIDRAGMLARPPDPEPPQQPHRQRPFHHVLRHRGQKPGMPRRFALQERPE